MLGCINTTSLYFFPSILGAAVFSTYIGSGHYLDLSVAYTVNTFFNLIKVKLHLKFNLFLVTIALVASVY